MKRNGLVIRVICMLGLLSVILSAMGCYQGKEKAYYSDKNNYISGEAIVDKIIYDEENHRLFLWLSEIDESYQDSTFKIEGNNVDLLMQSALFREISVGSRITFVSAPRYFGDGYCMPIVALSYNDVILLSFDEGYENLMSLF